MATLDDGRPEADGAEGRAPRPDAGGHYARHRTVDRAFSLPAHLAKTLLVAFAFLGVGIAMARDAAALHWLAVPGFWVVANFFEWAVHRYLMHRPMLRPRSLYRNHALIHHNAFAGPAAQEIQSAHELSVVMMPWYTVILVFIMASPIAVAATLVGGMSSAGIFLVAAVSYFLLYETIHTLHHLRTSTLKQMGLGNNRVLAALRRHHHHHHRLEHMAHTNFNVTAPLADAVLGTYYARR